MNERGITRIDVLAVAFAVVLCVGVLMPTVVGYAGRGSASRPMSMPEAARAAACANNLRNLAMATFQYTRNYNEMMPTAYENLWSRLSPCMDAKNKELIDVWRCPVDQFIVDQEPWGKTNHCSYAPNADETGARTLKPEDDAGWSVEVPKGSGRFFGAQYSPFTAMYKGGWEQSIVRLNSVAPDTILLAECWRTKMQNSLFLDQPRMHMRETKGVPKVETRNSLLLKQYTSKTGAKVEPETGVVTDAGPFNFLLDFAKSGIDAQPAALDRAYHGGQMNVLFADGHVELKPVKEIATGPHEGKQDAAKTVAEIPSWNRYED